MENTATAVELAFSFGNNDIRCELIENEPWFIAKDICDVLEIVNSRDAISRLDDDEKGVSISDTLGGKQEISIINESGMYTLVMRSNKPEAKTFRKWLTKEVLPSIRKTGQYSVKEPSYTFPAIESKAAVEYAFALKDLETAITFIRNITVEPKSVPLLKTAFQNIEAAKNTFIQQAPPIIFTNDEQKFILSGVIKQEIREAVGNTIEQEVQHAVNAALPAKYKK